MKTIAVLSGDLINSSEYTPKTLKAILAILKRELKRIKSAYADEAMTFSMYRGDSFQGVIENPELALRIALQIKCAINSYSEENEGAKNKTPKADIRIAIGIGEAEYDKNALAESNGQAFQYSGRTLDAMKGQGLKMALTTPNPDLNDEFKVSCAFLDTTTNRWSVASAEVVYYLLQNYKEQAIAKAVERSQAAINHRKQAADWDAINLLLQRYETVAKKHFV